MSITDTLKKYAAALRLDSHHAMERFGVVMGLLAILGTVVLTNASASAWQAGKIDLGTRAVYTTDFTTSKTKLDGAVEGVFGNSDQTRALVLMKFDDRAAISYNAQDYAAFLMGFDDSGEMDKVTTPNISASMHSFGSTGYLGVLLEAPEGFDAQVLNLTMRANEELSFAAQRADGSSAEDVIGDSTFTKYDQWRILFNPGGKAVTKVAALDGDEFAAADVFYDTVLAAEEEQVRQELDAKLLELRADLARIDTYTTEVTTTRVDGVTLRVPNPPESIAHDQVQGVSAAEAADKQTSTLRLVTDHVVEGGYDFDWRGGSVREGYFDQMLAPGQSVTQFLAQREEADPEVEDTRDLLTDMQWRLSDGTDLVNDYSADDVTMAPLFALQQRLASAYDDFYANKTEYQRDLLFDLLVLEVSLREVRDNASVRDDSAFMAALQ